MDLVMVMTSLGVSMFDEDLTHFNLDDPEVIVWLKQLNEMCAADRSLGSGEELSEFDWGASGRLGMTRDATFSILDWRQDWTDFEWDFVPCPKGSCCHTNIAGCDYHVVNGSNYADHEGGWEFIKFLNSPREDLWWATNMFGPPFRKSNLEAWAAKVSEILPKNGWRYLPDMAQGAEPWPTIPFSAEMNDIIWNELPQAIQGERAVEEVVESIVSKVDEVIAEYQQG
jgi:ABC-type glycerol-3-phosphate transport system substrate-binding protein